MTTVTAFTAERMSEIEGAAIIEGQVVGGNLILTKHNGETINAGSVVGPQGPQGDAGPPGFSFIPGQLLIWPDTTLPTLATYGKWVWADGTAYLEETYPVAASHINVAWKTFAGAANPGAGYFRVPDMRGLVPAGLDQMPEGDRAYRMTRSVAITIAAKTGEETHIISIPEIPAHTHDVDLPVQALVAGSSIALRQDVNVGGNHVYTSGSTGGGGAHENVQPTVFVPYIVKLDD